MSSNNRLSRRFKQSMGASCSVLALLLAAPAAMAQTEVPTIVPADPGTPATILDDVTDVTGVGMFYRSDGFVCSGTLFNRRTVIFAAHCVNDVNPAVWNDSLFGAWSFGSDAIPGFIDWINGGFASNPDMAVFNANQITFNLDSIARPEAQGFLEGDVAISVLDTPASEVPTWALLFSALPAPTTYTEEVGSGYHVVLNGYGGTGTATDGAIYGIDWRRRAAENFIGALASYNERNIFLYGAPFADLPQNLYRLDFDDPSRTNPYDFDLYGGPAAENEGTTAGGDSGGPLILDAANNTFTDRDLVLGVLSGGSRFFGPQPFSSYGTESYYQPLYLFWDWIAANNPVRFVSAMEGDGAWEDGSHWVTEVDPSFLTLNEDGELVNEYPDFLGAGTSGSDPSWGLICFAPGGVTDPDAECEALEDEPPAAAGAESVASDDNSIGLAVVEEDNAIGVAEVTPSVSRSDLIVEDAPYADESPIAQVDGEFSDTPRPAATLDNGLDGATDFVPDNIDPNVLLGINARYFDVNLSAAGTTTLSSTVEIDYLTISGGSAGLDITAAGDLTSLVEVIHQAGSVNVDGTLSTFGDYLLMSGELTGSGTINTPYLTNLLGLIGPGGLGTVGDLTINGSAILTSASGLAIEIGDGVSDQLIITGDASIGGSVLLSPEAGYLPRFGDDHAFLTANSVTGTFDSVNDLPGVLSPVLYYTGTTANVRIEAEDFSSQAAFSNHFQLQMANALDAGRSGSYDDLAGLFGYLDLLEGDDLTLALDTLAPYESVMFDRSIRSHSDVLANALRQHIGGFGSGSNSGDDILADAKQANGMAGMSDLGLLARANVKSGNATDGTDDTDTRRVFGSVGLIEASARTFVGSPDTNIDGDYSLIGLDVPVTESIRIGVAAGIANSDNSAGAALGSTRVSTESEQITAFASYASGRVSASFALGHTNHDSDASRTINLGGILVPAQTHTSANETMIDAAVRYDLYSGGHGVHVTPMASITASDVDFDATTSYATIGSLDIDARSGSNTIARLGAAFGRNFGANVSANLYLGAAKQYGDGAETYSAAFHSAPSVSFAAPSYVGLDTNWWEVAGSLAADMSFGGTLSISYERQLNRDFTENEITSLTYSLPF